VNIHRYKCVRLFAKNFSSFLKILEIVVIPFDREPVLKVESVTGHCAAAVRWLIRDSFVSGFLAAKSGNLGRDFMSEFLSTERDSKKNENNCQSLVNFFIY